MPPLCRPTLIRIYFRISEVRHRRSLSARCSLFRQRWAERLLVPVENALPHVSNVRGRHDAVSLANITKEHSVFIESRQRREHFLGLSDINRIIVATSKGTDLFLGEHRPFACIGVRRYRLCCRRQSQEHVCHAREGSHSPTIHITSFNVGHNRKNVFRTKKDACMHEIRRPQSCPREDGPTTAGLSLVQVPRSHRP